MSSALLRAAHLLLLVALAIAAAPAPRALAQATIGGPLPIEVEEEDDEPAPRAKAAPDGQAAPEPAAKGAKAEPKDEAKTDPAAALAPVPSTAAAEARREPPAGARSIQLPAEGEAALVERWRRRREHLVARDAKRAEEEVRDIERIREELALENLYGIATALIREADGLIRSGAAADAVERCAAAVRVAPRFDAAELCVARAALANDPLAVATATGAAMRAFSKSLDDVRSRRGAVADEALTFLFAFMLAAVALALLLIARYAKLFFHDFHHLFPKGISRWQSAFVALVLLSIPALFGGGALGSLALLSVAVALFLSRGESIAVGVSFVVLAVALFVMGAVMRSGSFGLVANDTYLLERGDAPVASASRLEKRLAAGLGDYDVAFALGRYFKRVGRYDDAAKAYEAAIKFDRTAQALNNLGNVRFLQGDSEAAKQLFRDANSVNASIAAPLHNIAKMYFREGKLAQGEQAQQLALELAGDEIRSGLGSNNETRANLYLLDISLSDAELEAMADREAEHVTGLGGPVMAVVTGRMGQHLAAILLLVAALVVGLAQALVRRLRPSSRCDKCGRAVCARCDPELGSTAGMCGQCISVFVRRSGVDAPDRIRKEIEVRRFRHRQRLVVRAVGLVLGGGGHVLAGRILAGSLFLVLFALPTAQVLFWNGFLRAPAAVELSTSPVRIALYAALLLATCFVSVRHLVKNEEAD